MKHLVFCFQRNVITGKNVYLTAGSACWHWSAPSISRETNLKSRVLYKIVKLISSAGNVHRPEKALPVLFSAINSSEPQVSNFFFVLVIFVYLYHPRTCLESKTTISFFLKSYIFVSSVFHKYMLTKFFIYCVLVADLKPFSHCLFVIYRFTGPTGWSWTPELPLPGVRTVSVILALLLTFAGSWWRPPFPRNSDKSTTSVTSPSARMMKFRYVHMDPFPN